MCICAAGCSACGRSNLFSLAFPCKAWHNRIIFLSKVRDTMRAEQNTRWFLAAEAVLYLAFLCCDLQSVFSISTALKYAALLLCLFYSAVIPAARMGRLVCSRLDPDCSSRLFSAGAEPLVFPRRGAVLSRTIFICAAPAPHADLSRPALAPRRRQRRGIAHARPIRPAAPVDYADLRLLPRSFCATPSKAFAPLPRMGLRCSAAASGCLWAATFAWGCTTSSRIFPCLPAQQRQYSSACGRCISLRRY